ncbi:MAG: hypothetical protein HY696_03850 [Deltaproteobacteria bacterium]|nr:hypothetical protein [Deltaproteobacteria bacterium]
MSTPEKIRGKSSAVYLPPASASAAVSPGTVHRQGDTFDVAHDPALAQFRAKAAGSAAAEAVSPIAELTAQLDLQGAARQRGRNRQIRNIANDFAAIRLEAEATKANVTFEPPHVPRFRDLVEVVEGNLNNPAERQRLLKEVAGHYVERREEILNAIQDAKAQLQAPNVTQVRVTQAILGRLQESLFACEREMEELRQYEVHLS